MNLAIEMVFLLIIIFITVVMDSFCKRKLLEIFITKTVKRRRFLFYTRSPICYLFETFSKNDHVTVQARSLTDPRCTLIFSRTLMSLYIYHFDSVPFLPKL